MTDTFQALRDLLANGVGSSNAKQPKKQTGPPHQGPTHLDHLVGELELDTDTYTDGTTTEVIIRNPENPTTYIGRGVARRRKGDPRNVEVGHTVALARALRDMADVLESGLR